VKLKSDKGQGSRKARHVLT